MTDAAIGAAWPRWWSEDAEVSPSARTELRFTVARRLGLDPHSVLGDEGPRFLWREEARFKHLAEESDLELAGITSFGRSVAAALLSAAPASTTGFQGRTSHELRRVVLQQQRPYVELLDLLALAWGVGVPVAHLKVFPWTRKRMSAMSVGVGDQAAVLMAKDSTFPATIAFYLAHEIAHIALGDVAGDRLMVDLEDEEPELDDSDAEEAAADAFALELLTGTPQPVVLLDEGSARATGRELARIAREASTELQIAPGVLAQCYGFSTGDWRTTTASLKIIYDGGRPVWEVVNRTALTQLDLDSIPADSADFLNAVLGAIEG